MPNWTNNTITFKSNKDLKFIINHVKSDYSDFDFNKLIPEPTVKENCPVDCLVTDNSHIEISKDRPWFDWYAWRSRFWNVKWNASEVYFKPRGRKIMFDTPWSAPIPIFQALACTYPGIPFVVKSSYEDGGYTKFTYNGDKSDLIQEDFF